MKRSYLIAITALVLIVIIAAGYGYWYLTKPPPIKRISIATGGTGGVYYPLGGGMAAVFSKYIPYTEATAEVTAASVDNCKLIKDGKADLALIMADVGYDAIMGIGKFTDVGKIPLRTLMVLYSNFMHVVTLEGSGITTVPDLKGKRVSTGAPGSGTEVKAERVLDAYGIDPTKDIKRERLGVAESAGALKDRKIDAFFWDGGLPTAAVLDVAATPGLKIRIIGHEEAITRMAQKWGPFYFKLVIPKGTYPGVDYDVPVAGIANVLVSHENFDEKLAYEIVKAIIDHQPELVAVHREAVNITLKSAVVGSSMPYHSGAIRYYKEKGVWTG